MDLRQMEYFVALAEEQQFTRAAAITQVSQSGLSSAIRSLESEVQAPLFTRTTRKVELTDAGRALLPHARALLSQATTARDAVVATKRELTGTLRIGAEQCLGVVDVSDLLERFHYRHPQVQIHFAQAGSHDLIAQLRATELDVVFVAGSSVPAARSALRFGSLDGVPIGSESLVLVCHPDSPVARAGRIGLAQLESESFIDFNQSWAVRRLNDDVFEQHDVRRRVNFTVNDVHTLLDLVTRGLGMALVPRPISNKPQAAGLAKVELADAGIPKWLVTAASHDRAVLAGQLLEMLPKRRLSA
ncbi:MAG: LysR family transcriptional regulator [Rhodoglobus sp.]|nr:LysR family transcriptional regulator [Rhodoglobus sp.]